MPEFYRCDEPVVLDEDYGVHPPRTVQCVCRVAYMYAGFMTFMALIVRENGKLRRFYLQ